MAATKVRVEPVTPARWEDFERLFLGRGCPSYCWCGPYRFSRSHLMSKEEKRAGMRSLVMGGTPIGILAYVADEPVGWCSVAPRESYAKLERSKTMPRVDADPTWTILCFFVRRDHRDSGVTRHLMKAAIRYAKALGAHVIEGYPFDTAGITSRHLGHSSWFEAEGFKREGRRWSRRLREGRRTSKARTSASTNG